MLKTTTQEFRKLFLLEFTRELIRATTPEEIIKINTILKEEEKEKKLGIKEHIKDKLEHPKRTLIKPKTSQIPNRRKFVPLRRSLFSQLRIPRNNLPERLKYLRPIPKEIEMNLGKLNNLIKNPIISSIECEGADKQIIVRTPNQKKIKTTLTREEIDQVINEFSKHSKIPVQQGIYKVAAGKLILLSAISEIVGTKFIINKISPEHGLMPR